jgi:ubiquinone/menaquinone biosynthesis C-methylase UbiE
MTARLDDRQAPPADDQMPMNPAETYERSMVPSLFAPAAERLLDAARPLSGERVLDVGTGTGIVARRAALRVGPEGTVTGLDPSQGMLAVARAMAEREGVPVAWHEGRAEGLPFPDGGFDLVLSQFALMFFRDLDAALGEMRRVLVPGGRALFSVFQGIERHPFYVALDRAIARRLNTSAVGAIFALGDAEQLRASLQRAGFREVTVAPFDITARFPNPDAFLASEIDVDTAAIPAMHGLDPAARRELVAGIAEEMAEPLRAATDGNDVRLTFHVQIASGQR